MASLSGNRVSAPLFFCHECSSEARPLMQPGPTCPQCGSEFVEEMSPPREDDEQISSPGLNGPQQHGSAGFTIGGMLSNLMSSFIGGGYPTNQQSSSDVQGRGSRSQWEQSGPSQGTANRGPHVRSGAGNLGPVAFQWHTASSIFPNNGRADSPRNGSSTNSTTNRDDHARPDSHARPDDGMGGAGGGADGRSFNFGSFGDEDGSYEQARQYGTGGIFGAERSPPARSEGGLQQPAVPPEFAALRNVFVDLFGATEVRNESPHGGREGVGVPTGDVLSGLFNTFFGGAAGGGRMGDYVFGQQGLDDIITQIMEQTQGSTAPPPASEATIAKLPRLKVGDPAASKLARNRECPTCLDVIIPSTAPSSPTHSRSASLTELTAHDDEASDDPPEYAPGEEPTSDTLVLLPCKHTAHEECLVPWLQRNGTCPICREALEPTSTTAAGDQEGQPQQQQGTRASTSVQTTSQTPHNPTDTASTELGEMMDTDEEDDDGEEDSPEERRRRLRQAAERRNAHPTAEDSDMGRGQGSTSAAPTESQDAIGIRSIPGGFEEEEGTSLNATQGDPYDLD